LEKTFDYRVSYAATALTGGFHAQLEKTGDYRVSYALTSLTVGFHTKPG
jgi:hypothetical protein